MWRSLRMLKVDAPADAGLRHVDHGRVAGVRREAGDGRDLQAAHGQRVVCRQRFSRIQFNDEAGMTLKEIKKSATTSTVPIADLLRQCKVLATELNVAEFES